MKVVLNARMNARVKTGFPDVLALWPRGSLCGAAPTAGPATTI